jgi:hypothetical protein
MFGLIERDARGRRLRASLAAVLVRDNAPELRLVREWLDSWSGIGLIIAGMTHQSWDVQLTATPLWTGGRTSSRSASPTPSSAARHGSRRRGGRCSGRRGAC